MKLKEPLASALSRAVDNISKIDGVVMIILFGSIARGEVDEGSDIDLFVVFESENSMRRHEWDVTMAIPKGALAHTICSSLESIHKLNPAFVKSVLEEGLVLLLKHPVHLNAISLLLSPHVLVSYTLSGLNRSEKQRLIYSLFGKGGREGIVNSLKGFKIGRGAFVAPEEWSKEVLKLLRERGVKFEVRRVYLRSDVIELEGLFRR